MWNQKRKTRLSCLKLNKFRSKQSVRKLDQTICMEHSSSSSPSPPWLRVEIEFTIIYD